MVKDVLVPMKTQIERLLDDELQRGVPALALALALSHHLQRMLVVAAVRYESVTDGE